MNKPPRFVIGYRKFDRRPKPCQAHECCNTAVFTQESGPDGNQRMFLCREHAEEEWRKFMAEQ